MPTRGSIWLIVAFWLVSMGLLFYLEVLPYFRSSDVPPFDIKLTDEVGTEVAWQLVLKRSRGEEKLIRVQSRINPLGGGEFEMVNECSENFELEGLHFRKARFAYHVTKSGELRGLEIEGELTHEKIFLHGKIMGKIKNGVLRTEYESNIFKSGMLPDQDFSRHPGVLNPMQLLNRLRDIREGQEWTVSVFDPLSLLLSMALNQAPNMPSYRAKVVTDTMEWDKEIVPCLKIEYSELYGGRNKLHAATWVRAADGLVLRQWSTFEGSQFTATRMPER